MKPIDHPGVSNDHAAWFWEERGITSTTLDAWGIHSMPDGAVAFPYGHDTVKLRYGIPHGERQFRWPSGRSLELFRVGEQPLTDRAVLLCEGETDCLRMWQELQEAGQGDRYEVCAIPGVEAWTEKMAKQLREADRVLCFLDNDPPTKTEGGYTRSQVDRAWSRIRRALGAKVRRVDLAPANVKDLCVFFAHFTLADMRGLIDRPHEYHYPALDLNLDRPTKVDWLVDEMIGKGDRCMVIGDPGTGKSWLAMALTVAIASLGAGIDAKWIGKRPSIQTGRVMYADEENPEAEVYRRLALLGLPPEARHNVRYLSQVGLRLDKEPELLMDDVIGFGPDLIVLDSLARFHSRDEQSAGDMARLFREGITPLARESGAAILVLHHKVKPPAKGSPPVGLAAARGSGDLAASIDQGFDVTANDRDTIKISHFKARRSLPHWPITAMIYDENDLVKISTL
jgi:hypothetical protein